MRAYDRRNRSGYTLIELMAVIVVLAAVLGVVVATIIAARSRLGEARLAAEGRFDALKASELMAQDIRVACGAMADGGLVLVHSKRRAVSWLLREERLVRVADGRERLFRTPVSTMRVSVKDGFVEVGMKLKKTERLRGGTLYVAARTRISPPEPRPGETTR